MELSPAVPIRQAAYDPSAIFSRPALYRETVRRLVELAVPALAEACTIDLIEDGVLIRRGVASASSAPLPNFPTAPHFDAPEGVAAVARTGRARYYRHGWLTALSRDDTTIAALGLSSIRSFSMLPLVFGETLLGVVSFACEHDAVVEGDPVLQAFARDAAIAIETSRLRERVADVQRRSEEARKNVAIISRAGRAFVGSVDLLPTLHIFFGSTIDAFADGGGVVLDDAHFKGVYPFGMLDEATLSSLAEHPVRLRRSVFGGEGRIVAAPIVTNGVPIGALVFRRRAVRPPFNVDDLTLVEEFALRVAAFVSIASTFARERHVSRTLQAALRPQRIPSVPGLAIAAAYRPSVIDIDVGGDWYDVIGLQGDGVAFVIGDVMGHGVEAAATMAQLRSGIAANLYGGLGPSDCLASADRVLAELAGSPTFASAIVAVYDRAKRTLTLANAGHPAPIVKRGTALDEGSPPSLMLGIDRGAARTETTVELQRGDLVAFYTDGIFEDRSRPYLEGLESLHEALSGAGGIADAERRLLDLAPSSSDDRTLLLVEID